MTARRPASGRTTLGGWGAEHQKRRAEVKKLVDAGACRGARCGKRLPPGAPFHLDHADGPFSHERGEYLGVSHPSCNVAAAHSHRRTWAPAPALAFFSPKSLQPNDHPEAPVPQHSPTGEPLQQWPIPLQRLPSVLDTI